MQQRFIRFFLRQTLQGDPTTAPQANMTILNFPRVHSVATSGRAQAWWRPAIGEGRGGATWWPAVAVATRERGG